MAEPEGRAVGDIADIKYLTRCLAFEPLNLLIHQSYAEDRGFGDIADIKYYGQYLTRCLAFEPLNLLIHQGRGRGQASRDAAAPCLLPRS